MIFKNCTKCNIEQNLSNFNLKNTSKDGLRSECKSCRKKISELYRINNQEKIKNSNKKWINNNLEIYKELTRQKSKQYRENNPDKIKETYKKWVKNNPDYEKIKHLKNPHIRAWRGVLHNSLKRLGSIKEGHTIDLLGYSALELKRYITNLFTDGMSWDNYGQWHIDHIKRICEFDLETSINIVNNLSNLRPLWKTTREINGIIYEGNLNRG